MANEIYRLSPCIQDLSLYIVVPTVSTEAVVDCVDKPRIFIQCQCLIASPPAWL